MVAIAELGQKHGLPRRVAWVHPIVTFDDPTPLKRLACSLLGCRMTRQTLFIELQQRRVGLELVLLRVASNPARVIA